MNRRRAAAKKTRLETRVLAMARAVAGADAASDAALGSPGDLSDPIEQLVVRARKLRQRGEMRRAVITLREAANRDEWRPRTWTLLGDLLARTGQRAEAARVLQRAQWLRARAGDEARAAVVERLVYRLGEAA
jgi:Flp pilus assembly protein TadD